LVCILGPKIAFILGRREYYMNVLAADPNSNIYRVLPSSSTHCFSLFDKLFLKKYCFYNLYSITASLNRRTGESFILH